MHDIKNVSLRNSFIVDSNIISLPKYKKVDKEMKDKFRRDTES